MEAVEMQVASCPAHGIGGAWAEVVVLFDPSAIGAAINLRGGHMNIFLEKLFAVVHHEVQPGLPRWCDTNGLG